MFNSVLVANRGEIALRVISTLQDHGLNTFVTSSDLDLNMQPAKQADGILHLEGENSSDTYLRIDKIVAGAKELGVDAIHPGYGFLSENPEFAEHIEKAGITFIGPTSKAMRDFGDKIQARMIAENANIPTVPGSETKGDETELLEIARQIGFPILIKAAGGGGGRGIRFVREKKHFIEEFHLAQSEAKTAFNDERLYVEKFIPQGRHIEVQILGDNDGNVFHFGERDCSLQRKNQKLVEESPAIKISKKRVMEIQNAAVKLIESANYRNAGTVEFLVDNKSFYFLEVNARIQVEHPVTEMVTGEDLIWRQIQVAANDKTISKQSEIQFKGHAIEARIYAENPYNNFQPSPGKIQRIIHPVGPGVRVDTAIEDGSVISPFYDPMISKIIVHSPNRESATRKLVNNLDRYFISGVHTTIPYIKNLIQEDAFAQFQYHTRYLETYEQKIPKIILNLAQVAAVMKSKVSVNSSNTINQSTTNLWKTAYWVDR